MIGFKIINLKISDVKIHTLNKKSGAAKKVAPLY